MFGFLAACARGITLFLRKSRGIAEKVAGVGIYQTPAVVGARSRNRTGTPLRARDFKSEAKANVYSDLRPISVPQILSDSPDFPGRGGFFAVFCGTNLCLALAGCGGGAPADSPPAIQAPPVIQTETIPTVALTFDYYGSTYQSVFPMLKARGLVGTFFVDPDTIDAGQATTAQLTEMRAAGWSIQAYTGVNMESLLADSGPSAALARLNHMKTAMAAKGFDVTSIAPASRAWNAQLRNLVAGIYTSVRANNDTTAWQSYPLADPLYAKQGATASLSSTDTAASLGAQLDSLEASRGLWVVVVHKVGDSTEPWFSIPSDTMAAFLDRLAADVAAGKVRVVTFEKALVPAYRPKAN